MALGVLRDPLARRATGDAQPGRRPPRRLGRHLAAAVDSVVLPDRRLLEPRRAHGATPGRRRNDRLPGKRLRRLLLPIAVFVGVWLVGDAIARLWWPSYSGVLDWGLVVFVPLWFIGVYTGVVLLAPTTERWHRRAPFATIAALGATALAVDAVRFVSGLDAIGYLNGVIVFGFVHQLGYFYGDKSVDRRGRRGHLAIAAAGLASLVTLTTLGPYPTSMVATEGTAISNLNPPTAPIATLAVFQLGLLLLARPVITRWLQRRGPWKAVIAVNSVLMTVFAWHMTAWVAAMLVLDHIGIGLGATPDAGWWASRPIWLIGPLALLVPLVALFKRFE